MAGERTQAFIAKERQAGTPDIKIFNKMLDDPNYVQSIRKANAAGLSNRDIAAGLGLNIQRTVYDPNGDGRKELLRQAKDAGKTQAWESGLLGFSDLGAGIMQGFAYAGDGISKGINKVTGSNLSTDNYERFTRERKSNEDWHNLRREANGQGFDWTRLGGQVAATAPMAALGRGYQGASVLSKAGMGVTAQNAALGALIGGAGFAENADKRMANTALGAAGGAAGAVIGEKVGQGIAKGVKTAKSQASRFSTEQTNRILQSIDQKLDDVLQQSGISFGDLTDTVKQGLRDDAKKILQSGKDINPTTVARKAVLDRLGLKGTQAQLTGDNKLLGRQAELAKIDGAGDPIRYKLIDDNTQLKNLLDDAVSKTGGKSSDQYGAMRNALDSIDGQLAQNKSFVNEAYAAARAAPGNDIPLDGRGFANDAFTALEQNYAASSLPANIQKIIKDVNDNPDLFTLGKSEELIKVLNRELKASMQNGQPTSTSHAIGIVRDALNGRQNQAMQGLLSNGNDAAKAYQFARGAHKFNVEQIESMPLLQDALKGVEPDKLFSQHILNGKVAELKQTIDLLNNVNPQAVNDIKQQVIEHISNKAVNLNGEFSPAGMKRALDSITERRLLTMFSQSEVRHIQDIGKAGHYLVSQPKHAYVNNSNTASTVANYLNNFIDKPGIRKLISPIKDIKDGVQVGGMMKSNMPAGQAVAQPTTQAELSLIDKLMRAGLLGGASLPQQ